MSPVRSTALAALVCLIGCKSVDEKKDEPVVRKLRIEGARQVSAGDLTQRILTSQTSWIPFSQKQHFEPEVWKTDLKRIERYYRARGFYQARVVSDEVKPVKDGVELTAQVEEGDPTRVGTISLTGIEQLPQGEQKTLRGIVALHPGDVFLEDDWEGLKQHLTDALEELGYADATAEGEAKVDVATHRADLKIEITPGPRRHFGPVSVGEKGNTRIEEWRIRERAEEDVKQGDVYSVHAQSQAQSRVTAMGVFGAVKVHRLPTDPATGEVPIKVAVEESPFHTIRLGGGIGVDQTRNEIRGIAEYTDRNFLGGLRRLTLSAKAGWAFLPNFAQSSGNSGGQNGPIALITAELEQPRIFHPDLKANLKLDLERGIEPAYRYFGGRAKLGLVWQPWPWLSIYPSYNFEAYRLQSGVAELGGSAPTLLFGCPENCLLSYLEERIEVDRRDNRLEPHRGYFLGLSLQEGGGFLAGSFRFLRILPEARGYLSFGAGDRFTLAARVRGGTLRPAAGEISPIVSRFFSGGNQMRGFGYERLSPQIVTPVTAINPSAKNLQYTGVALPIGGDGLFESSLEARYRLVGPLVVAAFVDTGTVTVDSFNFREIFNNMLYAFGVGARYGTPVGPIRLDFAYRPNIGPPLPLVVQDPTLTYYSPTQCFGLGGHNGTRAGSPEDPCTIQLSVGEAF